MKERNRGSGGKKREPGEVGCKEPQRQPGTEGKVAARGAPGREVRYRERERKRFEKTYLKKFMFQEIEE